MKSNISKKIITLTYLLIFIFSLLIPFNKSLAATYLELSANKLTLKSGEDVFIVAKAYGLTNKLITFKATPTEGVIFVSDDNSSGTTGTCTTSGSTSGGYSSCNVGFRSTKKGTFKINASMPYNGITNDSNNPPINITITEENLSPKCKAPEGLDAAANKCRKCLATETLTSGICKQKDIEPTEEACLTVNRTLNKTTKKCECLSPKLEVNGICTTIQPKVNTDTTYQPLAPLPDGKGGMLTTFETDPSKNACPFGKYLNIVIKLIIGMSAVLAMVMITMGGVQYISSELVSGKEEGRETIKNAIFGLMIALGAYLILNTINPQLLNVCLDGIKPVEITIIENFEASGALTFNGTPIKVNFNKEAYPSAKTAEQKTGVSKSLILAIFAQETNNGVNSGGCNYLNANMSPGELTVLKEITNDWATVKVSCSGGGSSHGGAIGLTQFLPSTWKQFRGEAEKLLGHKPNAWNVGDALMMAALKLKSNNGINNPEGAACKYFGSCAISISCGNNKTGTYGQCVMGKKLSIEQQINDSIKKGEITP